MTSIKSNQCSNASQTGTYGIKSLPLQTLNSFTISSSNIKTEVEHGSGGGGATVLHVLIQCEKQRLCSLCRGNQEVTRICANSQD